MKLSHIATAIAGFVVGILISSVFDFGVSFGWLILLVAFVFFARARLFSGDDGRDKIFVHLFIFCVFISLAIFRYDFVNTKSETSLAGFVRAEGLVTDEPILKDKNVTLKVALEKILNTDGELISETPIRVLVTSKGIYRGFSYGDRIEIIGDLKRVRNFLPAEGGDGQVPEFDYAAYLAKDEIYYQFQDPKIILISSGHGFFLQRELFNIKNSFLKNINRAIPEPESALMGGIVIGVKSSLGKEILEEWRRVGLIQVVVLSGYNISVVADVVAQIFSFLPLGMRIGFGSLAIILFSMMTAGGATVVRATIMALLALLARATGRIYLSGAALLVGGVLIVLYNPKTLVFDTSFQLSFLATAGLIFFSPIIERMLDSLELIFKKAGSILTKVESPFLKVSSEKFNLKSLLSSTIAAQLAVFPLISYKMGVISLVSIPANILVSPLVPITMFLGFLTGIIGYLSYLLSLPSAYLSYIILAYDLKIAGLFASLPFASVNVPFPFWLAAFIYLLYIFIVVRNSVSSKN
ncbi:ComEC/Rec2 family competence protein [Candidatus Gottesmanbacteria bacterium]|nr:ComEC/Rec2 family competence protein [Candidatus Gottesmanbacteria bacterium]